MAVSVAAHRGRISVKGFSWAYERLGKMQRVVTGEVTEALSRHDIEKVLKRGLLESVESQCAEAAQE